MDKLLGFTIDEDILNDEESAEKKEPAFVDSFRHFHPSRQHAFTCWNTRLNCRETNFGTRLDYILIGQNLSDRLKGCDIHPEIMGSDHCPVKAEIDLTPIPSNSLPQICTSNFIEFGGCQKKVSSFFQAPCPDKRKPENDCSKALKKSAPACKQAKLSSFFKPSVIKKEPKSVRSLTDEGSEDTRNIEKIAARIESSESSVSAWKSLFKGPPPAPMCPGHKEPAARRTVKKKGPNQGRQFWSCSRGEGKVGDTKASCEFFQWCK